MILTTVSVSSLFTFVFLPLGVLGVFALAAIPCLSAPGAKPSSAIKALYCTLMQCIGVALMTAGALPAVYGVIEKFSLGTERFSAEMYLALLILFSCGGITFLWHEQVAERIDDASRKVPALLFWYTFKALGYVLAFGALLSLLFTMLLTRPLTDGWWVTAVTTFLYGLLLSWCTRWPPRSAQSFKLMPLNGSMRPATAGRKRK